MAIEKSNNIKKFYSDTLYWAMSPKSKGKLYHLGRVDESILRKLIHYDKTNSQIKYSSEWIAKHTFLDVTQIEKSIPKLDKIGYIKNTLIISKDDSGNKIRRRIININWGFIQQVLDDIPKNELADKTEDTLNQPIQTNETIIPDIKIIELDEDINTVESNTDSNELTLSNSLNDDTIQLKYQMNEIVSLYDILEHLGYEPEDVLDFIYKIDTSYPTFESFINKAMKLYKEKKYSDYKGIIITREVLAEIKNMVIK